MSFRRDINVGVVEEEHDSSEEDDEESMKSFKPMNEIYEK